MWHEPGPERTFRTSTTWPNHGCWAYTTGALKENPAMTTTSTYPTPAASGTVDKTPVANLLIYVAENKLSGTLEITPPGAPPFTILLTQGCPVKVKSAEVHGLIGSILVDLGNVSPNQVSRALDTSREQKRMVGEVLIEQGALTQPELERALSVQLERKLLRVFKLPLSSQFAFYKDFDALVGFGAKDARGIDAANVIWRGMKVTPPLSHVEAVLSNVGSSLLRVPEGVALERFRLSPAELDFAKQFSLRDIRADRLPLQPGVDDATARLLVYLLVSTKVLTVTANPNPPSIMPPRRLSTQSFNMSEVIKQRAETVLGQDLYAVLGLSVGASVDEARSAYSSLVRTWHPDRIPDKLAELRPQAATVFARLTEAHEVLSNETSRAKYMAEHEGGSATEDLGAEELAVRGALDAIGEFQRAEVYLKKRDYALAEIHARAAVEGDDTQADYIALLAWILSTKADYQNDESIAMLIKDLSRAVEMSPLCERARHYRGMLLKRAGKTEEALKDFKKAVEINPANIDAARELRLHFMRTSSGPASKTPPSKTQGSKSDQAPPSSFLQRLFKRS